MRVEEKIKEYIKQKGIRQITLSQQTGIATPKLNLSLNGHRRLSFTEYELICSALNVAAGEFLSIQQADK